MTIAMLPLSLMFFLTALLYASVGFGGGSTYLALLYLSGLDFRIIPILALLCNIIVVSANMVNHVRTQSIESRIVIPFLMSSIPCAFIGGLVPIGKSHFLWILGLSLLAAALRLFLTKSLSSDNIIPKWSHVFRIGLPVGSILGFVSGITGLGGGIFLAPILYLLKWGHPRQIAASASLFILLNSISGITGHILKSGTFPDAKLILPLGGVVLAGAFIGSNLGHFRWQRFTLQRVTALLILFVSLRILWDKFH